MTRILALVPAIYNISPGQRFRIEMWEKHLKPYGIEITYAPFEDMRLREILSQKGYFFEKAFLIVKSFLKRLFQLPSFKRFDAIYLYREASLIGPAILERFIHFLGIPIVYDFDDAIWLPGEGSANRGWSRLRCPGKTATICKLSVHVIVGNNYLAEYTRKYNPNVSVIPSVIDTTYHTLKEERETSQKEPIVIGWTGSYSTIYYLDAIHGALQRLAQKHPIEVHVIGTSNYRIKDVVVIPKDWKLESEISDLHQFDIGIMPLPDDDWARGKCGFKILQYMASGIPAVASPVGVNSEIIENGKSGYLASSEGEWVDKLSMLIKDYELRKRMGLAGRKRVEEHYSIDGWIGKIADVMKAAARH